MIYTTNAVEALNGRYARSSRRAAASPSTTLPLKLLYLAIKNAGMRLAPGD